MEGETPVAFIDGKSPAPVQHLRPGRRVDRLFRRVGDPRDRWVRRALVGVLLGSLALRLAFLAGHHSAPFSDMTGYDERALLLLHDHTFQTGTAYGATYHGPGYIVFLAVIYAVAGHHWWAVYVAQSLLGTATLLGIYLLARRLFSPGVAVVALLLSAGYLPFLAYAHVLMPETLFVTFLVFFTYAFVRGLHDNSRLWLGLSGILCAFAALTRSVALLLPVVFLLWIVFSPGRWLILHRLKSGLILFILSMALVLTPWSLHNYLDQKYFIPGDTVGGLNLLIGNHPGANGSFDEAVVWSNSAVQMALSEGKREAALDDVFRDQAVVWISSHPGSFLVLTGRRMLLFLGAPNDWLVDGIGSNTLDAVSRSQWVYTWALLLFALVGGFAGLRRGRQTLLPLLCFLYFLGVVSLFYVQARYRLPAMPFALMLAAYGLSMVGGGIKRIVSASPTRSSRSPRDGSWCGPWPMLVVVWERCRLLCGRMSPAAGARCPRPALSGRLPDRPVVRGRRRRSHRWGGVVPDVHQSALERVVIRGLFD